MILQDLKSNGRARKLVRPMVVIVMTSYTKLSKRYVDVQCETEFVCLQNITLVKTFSNCFRGSKKSSSDNLKVDDCCLLLILRNDKLKSISSKS